MAENNEESLGQSQTQDPTSETGNQATSNGNTNPFRRGGHLEQISGCVGMIRNFTAGDAHYTAEHFLQDFEEVATIGNWSDLTKLVVLKSKLRERAADTLAESEELNVEISTISRCFSYSISRLRNP